MKSLYNISIIGDFNVGKTTLINRISKNTFDNIAPYSQQTIVGFNTNKGMIKLNLMDMICHTYPSDGTIIVFDVTNKESFDSVKTWYSNRTNIVICGNKCDLKNRIIEKNKDYIDASAIDFEEIFLVIIRSLLGVDTNLI